jgi:hypothetical protein
VSAELQQRIAHQRERNQASIEKAERFLLWSRIVVARAAFTADCLRAARRERGEL